MPHLFFCYAHEDYNRLLPVLQQIELVTERMIWVDRTGLKTSHDWPLMIQRAIQSSYGVIIAITKTFLEQDSIFENEISWIIERFNDSRQGKLIFPILFDDVELPDLLKGSNLQFCKYVLDARHDHTEHIGRELKAVLPDVLDEEYPFIVSLHRLRNFHGREQQLINLHRVMQEGVETTTTLKAAALYGVSGIGKTQLAVEFVYRYRFYFPGGVFWLNAAQDWQEEVVGVADRLGLRLRPMTSLDADRNQQMVFAFKGYLDQISQDTLLIMDTVANPEDLATRELAPSLTIMDLCLSTQTHLIITTRSPISANWEKLNLIPLEIYKVSPSTAFAILVDPWDTKVREDALDTRALAAIAELVDFRPLALNWMAAAFRQMPDLTPAELLTELQTVGIDEAIQLLKDQHIKLEMSN